MEKIVEVNGLSKSYDNKDNDNHKKFAIKDISFSIRKGEKWGIIGGNGVGKSTILKILSQIIKPSHGSAKIYGLSVSILSLGGEFIGDFTGRQNVEMYFVLKSVSKLKIPIAINEVEKFADIGAYFDLPVKTYSDGMFLRLAFAACIQLDFDILFLDEVFSVGDANFQGKLKQYFLNLKGINQTLLMVSHNPSDILSFCTNCIWLEEGKIKMIGSAKDVETAYYSQIASHNWNINYNKSLKRILTPDDTVFYQFGNEIIGIDSIEILAADGGEEICYESGIKFIIVVEKKQIDIELRACINIFDFMLNPIFSLVANSEVEFDKQLKANNNKLGKFMYSVILPKEILAFGNYYAEFSIAKNFNNQSEFLEEAIKSPNKIHFEVKKGVLVDYAGGTTNNFIRPRCRWSFDYLS